MDKHKNGNSTDRVERAKDEQGFGCAKTEDIFPFAYNNKGLRDDEKGT